MTPRSLIALAAAAFLVVGLGYATAATTDTKEPEHVYTVDPIVQLAKDDASSPDEFKGYCTGWYVGNGLVVSAGHCVLGDVDKAVTMLFTKTDGTVQKAKGHVVAWGHPAFTYDYSVIKLFDDVDAKPMSLDCKADLYVGREVFMTGYPLGGVETTLTGRVSTKAFKAPFGGFEARKLVGINISSVGGFSGSPVTDAAGDVLAILVAGFPMQPSLALALPVSELCPILDLIDG